MRDALKFFRPSLLFLSFFWPLQTVVPSSDPPATLPQFRLKLLDGAIVNDKDFRKRIAIIDFWGTWCGPCIAEIGDYNRFFSDYKDKGVRFVGVAVDSGTESEVRQEVKRLKIGYPVAVPTSKELDVFGEILVFPTTWVVDRRGNVRKVFLGAPPDKHTKLRALVDALLKEK
jgi:thiol-disulfide isomerase/thioredoxin